MLELVMPVTVTGTIAGVVIAVKGSETLVNPLAVAVTVITGVEPGVNPEIHAKVLGFVAVKVGTAVVPLTLQVYVIPEAVQGHVTVVLVHPQAPCVSTGFLGGRANTTFADAPDTNEVDCLYVPSKYGAGRILYGAIYRFVIEPDESNVDVDGIVVVYPPPPSVAATGTGDSVVIHGTGLNTGLLASFIK
jgi:hypothetical protein